VWPAATALEADVANGVAIANAATATPAIAIFVPEFNIAPFAGIDPWKVWAAFKQFLTK
jgi:hypothetical protein